VDSLLAESGTWKSQLQFSRRGFDLGQEAAFTAFSPTVSVATAIASLRAASRSASRFTRTRMEVISGAKVEPEIEHYLTGSQAIGQHHQPPVGARKVV